MGQSDINRIIILMDSILIWITRYIRSPDLTLYTYPSNNNEQLIGFFDASLKGYAAIVYLRLSYVNAPPMIHLITALSKVGPIKSGRANEFLSVHDWNCMARYYSRKCSIAYRRLYQSWWACLRFMRERIQPLSYHSWWTRRYNKKSLWRTNSTKSNSLFQRSNLIMCLFHRIPPIVYHPECSRKTLWLTVCTWMVCFGCISLSTNSHPPPSNPWHRTSKLHLKCDDTHYHGIWPRMVPPFFLTNQTPACDFIYVQLYWSSTNIVRRIPSSDQSWMFVISGCMVDSASPLSGSS